LIKIERANATVVVSAVSCPLPAYFCEPTITVNVFVKSIPYVHSPAANTPVRRLNISLPILAATFLMNQRTIPVRQALPKIID